jgi:hypothetical protein
VSDATPSHFYGKRTQTFSSGYLFERTRNALWADAVTELAALWNRAAEEGRECRVNRCAV